MSATPTRPSTPPAPRQTGGAVGGAAALDVALVLVFVLIGRASHAEGITLPGVLETAWPFLAGLLVGWALSRAWREPCGVLSPGLAIAACAVGVGLALRGTMGDGVPLGFAVVTTIVLSGFLLGWRVVVALLRRFSRRRR